MSLYLHHMYRTDPKRPFCLGYDTNNAFAVVVQDLNKY